jgi:hypothetical protein
LNDGPKSWRRAMLAIAVLVLAGCGGGSSPSPTPGSDTSLRAYHSGHPWGLSFRHPASWKPRDFNVPSSFSTAIVYLSNQPLHKPCVRKHLGPGRFSVRCGEAVNRLRPGGVLVQWSKQGFAGWTIDKAPGRPVKVDGLNGRLQTRENECGRLRADHRMLLAVQDPHTADNWYELRACSRGPDSASTEAALRDMIASTRFVDFKGQGERGRSAKGPVVREGPLAGRLIAKPASAWPGQPVGVAVRNLGREPLGYGLAMEVERKIGGEWASARTAVYGPGPVAFPLPLFTVPPSHISGPRHGTGLFDGVTLPRDLEPGRYRFVKRVSGEGPRSHGHRGIRLSASFRVRGSGA